MTSKLSTNKIIKKTYKNINEFSVNLKCPIKNKYPFVIKSNKDIYLIYKPPLWNCATDDTLNLMKKKIKTKKIIVEWIKNNLYLDKSVSNYDVNYGLLNRLDYETSGIIMVAKNIYNYNKFRKTINDHLTTTKIYITLVQGDIPHIFGIITLPLLVSNLYTYVDYDKGLNTYTEYIKLSTYKDNNELYSLLLVKIKTGRTHQIRAHFKNIGYPIVCDKYNSSTQKINKNCNLSDRLFLHAFFYKINNNIETTVCIPNDLQNKLDKMKHIRKFYDIVDGSKILKNNQITNIIINNNEHEISKGTKHTKKQYNKKYFSNK